MTERLIFEILKAAFQIEISNYVQINDKEITIDLDNGKRTIAITNNNLN